VRILNAPEPGAAIPISTLTGGPLAVGLGGTGLAAIGGANLCLKVNSAGTALEFGGCAAGGTGITSLNGQAGSTQSFATGTAGSNFGISSAGDTHTFNLPSASGANRGALTSADWTTFNNKQPALSTSSPVANQFVTGFTAPDTFTRAQPSFSNVSGSATAGQVPNLESLNGTLDVPSGGTGAAPSAGDQALVSDSTSTATWRALPNCNTENMLTYSTATNAFGCEADDGGGGGGGDNLSVGGSAATDANFTDSSEIDFSLNTGPAPDEITAALIAGSVAYTRMENTSGVLGIRTAVKTADETVNNSGTLQNDDHLSIAVGANEIWIVRMALNLTIRAASDFQWAFTLPSGGTATALRMSGDFTVNVGTPDQSQDATAAITVLSSGLQTIGYGGAVIVKTAGTSGTAQLQWAQNTATPEDTSVLVGSSLIAFRVN
jgi:hypothetical protein